jgi:hypothetical protein
MASATREERRQQQLTRRCAWCDTIEVDGTWRPERRDPAPPATHTICPGCFARSYPRREGARIDATTG